MQEADNKKIIDVDPENREKQDIGNDLVKVEARPRSAEEPQKSAPNISIGTLNIFNAPLQGLQEPLERRYHRYYHERHPHGGKHLVVDLLLLFTVVSLLGVNFFFYLGFGKQTLLPRVQLEIAVTPEMPRIGDVVTVKTRYTNDNKDPLENVTLSFQLPVHFRMQQDGSDFLDPKTRTISLGIVPPGANGTVTFVGQLYGNSGEDALFSVRLSTGQDSDRREQKLVLAKVPLKASTVAASFAMPRRVVTNVPFSFSVILNNEGPRESLPISLKPVWPSGFTMGESSLPLGGGLFPLQALAAGGKKEIRISGTFRGSGEGEARFAFESFARDGDDALALGAWEERTPVFYPKFTAGLSADPIVATLGEELTMKIGLENNEAVPVVDASIELTLDPKIFNLATLTTEGEKQEEGVLFRSATISDLAYVKPKEKREVMFSVTLQPSLDSLLVFGERERVIFLQTRLRYRLESDLQEVIESVSEPLVVQLNSDFGLAAFARYYSEEGEQLGRGPLPPIVGSATKYWLFLHVTNTIHDVDDVVVTAVLPRSVEWTKRASVTFGDAIRFHEPTRTLVWRLEHVPGVTGSFAPDIGALVELALTPSDGEAGVMPPLATSLRAEAKDRVTSVLLKREVSDVTTELSLDRKARGKGKVGG